MADYDIIIIGSGPAGLTAAIYAGRALVKTLVLAGRLAGGQLMLTSGVENFPGFSNGIQGPDLMQEMRKQAERFGAEILDEDVESVDFKRKPFKVTAGNATYAANAIVLATGSSAKWLGLPAEEKMRGHGVSSCATCLPPESPIIANPRVSPIGDIREGDLVLTHKGTFEPVSKVYKRPYSGSLVNVKVQYFAHQTLRLTPNHPVLAARLTRGKGARYWNFRWERPRWVRAAALTKDDFLLLPIPRRTIDRSRISVSRTLHLHTDSHSKVHLSHESYTAHRIPNIIPVDDAFMRLSGYFLSDGCITNRGFNVDFAAKDVEYVEDARQLIRRLFGIEPTVKRVGDVFRILVFSKILRGLMTQLFGRYSYGKSMPDWFLFLPKRKQSELVKGYWRGDGATKKLDFEMVTNSKKLVAQFQLILLRLGIIPSIRVQRAVDLPSSKIGNRTVRFKHDRYVIAMGGASLEKAARILGVENDLLTRRTRTHHSAWLRNGFAILPIRNISKESYSGYVYNLAVKDSKSYVSPLGALHNCDGYFFRDKRVVVVGGGDTAIEEALFLTKYATEVLVVHRRDALRASKIMQHRAMANPKIKFVWNSVVDDILGTERVEGVRVKNVETGDVSMIPTDGVFVAIGFEPNSKIYQGQVQLDEKGYIVSPGEARTSVEGVFVAGDVHDYRYRQAITAAGEGCKAAMEALTYLEEQKEITVSARGN